MCNMCNSSFNFGRSGCGCNNCDCNCCNNGCGNSLFNLFSGNGCGCSCNNGTTQSVCRDGCGNLRIVQRNSNGCGCNNGCNNGCSCHNNCGCNNCSCNNCSCNNGSTFTVNGGNSRNFGCVSVCGNLNTIARNIAKNCFRDDDSYYNRQYGLTSSRSSRSCDCGCDN